MSIAWSRRAGLLVLLLAVAGLVVPTSAVHPVTLRLTEVETAKEVDAGDRVVWLLALGSDAAPGQQIEDARTDAIHLVGLDLDSGRAVGIGVPRDYYVDLPGEEGMGRINEAVQQDGDGAATAEAVAELVGFSPEYVLLADFDGFRGMVDSIGEIEVRSRESFTDPRTGLPVEKGINRFDADEALDYVRSRRGVTGDDLGRAANQQVAMVAILRAILAREDEPGFLEAGTLAAITGLRTDLAPTEVYRLAQAVTQVRPDRVTTCVLPGTFAESAAGESVILPAYAAAKRIGADAREDVRLDGSC